MNKNQEADMKKQKWITNSIVVCLIASLCCALWGSAFPFVKIGYKMLHINTDAANSQILFAGTRFALAGVMTIVIGSCLSKQILVPSPGSWLKIINLSIFQTILQYVLFYIGLAHTTGVYASIIEGTNVFVALLVAALIFRLEKLTSKKMLGCIIGFIGVIIINLNGSGFNTNLKMVGEGFVFLSTAAYAFSSVMMKQYSRKENPIVLSGYQFIIGGAAMMLVGFLLGGNTGNYTAKSAGILIYLAFVSAAAYSLWGILLKYNPISKVAVYGFMTPVFGVLLSTLILQENQFFGLKCIAALILVSAGIYIVNASKNKSENIK
jgi:drug/metabolite transporter (DMT)-like permease